MQGCCTHRHIGSRPPGVIYKSSMLSKGPESASEGAEVQPTRSPGHLLHCWRGHPLILSAPLFRKATWSPVRCLLADPRDRTYLTQALPLLR